MNILLLALYLSIYFYQTIALENLVQNIEIKSSTIKIIETERLVLRTWKEEDVAAYFKINQDPEFIKFLAQNSLDIDQVKDYLLSKNRLQEIYGYSSWAVELKDTGELIGLMGLNYADFDASFTPAVEIGWRLGLKYWGKGYATEGAKAVLKYGFEILGLKEIVAFSVPENRSSIKVMENIGMQRDLSCDFAYPKLAIDHPLSKNILYRIQK